MRQKRLKNLLTKLLLTAMGLFLCLLLAPADKVYAWDFYTADKDTYGWDKVEKMISSWRSNNLSAWQSAYGYTPSLLYEDGDLVGEVADDDYKIGSDCPSDSTRYMLEWKTDSRTCPDYDMYCSIVYTDSRGYIHWLEPFDFRDEWEDYKKEKSLYMRYEKVFHYGELGYLEVTLPDCRDVLGVYLSNWSNSAHDSEPWGFSYFTIAKVDTSSTPQLFHFGDIRDVTIDMKTIKAEHLDYTGTYMGSIADDHDYLNHQGWRGCLYLLQTPKMNGISQNPAVTKEVDNPYCLHMVAENMYSSDIDFSVTINYTDVMGITRDRKIEFSPTTMIPHDDNDYFVKMTGDDHLSYINARKLFYTSDSVYDSYLEQMFNDGFYKTRIYSSYAKDIVKKYIGNYPKDEAFDAEIHPYAASDWEFYLYGGMTKINSITVASDSTPVKLQTIAV